MNNTPAIKKDIIAILPDETLALCRCWKSKSFPKCDGSHRDLSSGEGPIVVTVSKDD